MARNDPARVTNRSASKHFGSFTCLRLILAVYQSYLTMVGMSFRWLKCRCDSCTMVEHRRHLNSQLRQRKSDPYMSKSLCGKRVRHPKCARCGVHGQSIPLRGHKKTNCAYSTCTCDKVKTVLADRIHDFCRSSATSWRCVARSWRSRSSCAASSRRSARRCGSSVRSSSASCKVSNAP